MTAMLSIAFLAGCGSSESGNNFKYDGETYPIKGALYAHNPSYTMVGFLVTNNLDAGNADTYIELTCSSWLLGKDIDFGKDLDTGRGYVELYARIKNEHPFQIIMGYLDGELSIDNTNIKSGVASVTKNEDTFTVTLSITTEDEKQFELSYSGKPTLDKDFSL